MFSFFLKKNFCDVWDNLFPIVLSNLFPVAVISGTYMAIMASASISPYAPNFAFMGGMGILMAVIFAWGANARKLADFNTPSWKLFFVSFKSVAGIGFISGVLLAAFFLVARIAFTFYFAMYAKDGDMFGLLLAAVIGWFVFVVAMALQWFVPLYFLQEENNLLKCVKKSFIIFFDNTLFSFAMFVHNAVLLALTVLSFGFIPGLNGITLSNTNALRLRLYKYDWFEEHPEVLEDREKRSEIPWDELLSDDRESLGPRKLSSFLFPWR